MTSDPDEKPEFGPGGYLPRRAAQRARKIVLREQMGLGWPIAAVAAAVVVAVVGAAFLLMRAAPPGPPFVPLAPVTAVEPNSAATVAVDGPIDVLVVRAGGGVQVYEAAADAVVYCPASRRLEAPGRVWDLQGRLVGGDGESLRPVPSTVHEAHLYVDPSPGPPPAPAPGGETPACVP